MAANRGRRLTPESAERMTEIVALRRQRMTQDAIARKLGISQQRVSQLYQRALAEIPAYQVDEHRAEELLLIDDAISALLVIARDYDTSARTAVEAWTSIRGWAERKAKLLGLDAPDRHEFITIDAIDREIAALNTQLGDASVSG